MHITHLTPNFLPLISSGALLCHPREKTKAGGGVGGEVTIQHSISPLPKRLLSKGSMERIKIRGAVTEMSLYQNCNSVRNTNLQTSDEQWSLEGKNKRLTRAEGLVPRGLQAVQDLWTICYHLPGYLESLSPTRYTWYGCLSCLLPWSQYSSFKASALSMQQWDSKGFPIFILR